MRKPALVLFACVVFHRPLTVTAQTSCSSGRIRGQRAEMSPIVSYDEAVLAR
jgi:hypothetical protein